MTKKEALQDFNQSIKDLILSSYGRKDKIAMREAWNNYTDSLCKNGLISPQQYSNWSNPF